ncbi:Hematopoietic lineage cell-specific protein [Blastocladiella emersonii ATCC 22665]|nr:Hematopoietic lineage cell-specific protein [Blastocladiella emersonii ATCC 22665]
MSQAPANQAWKATTTAKPAAPAPAAAPKPAVDDDDWETDPDFVNDVSEKQSRWGSKSIPETMDSRTNEKVKLSEIRDAVKETHDAARIEEYKATSNFSRGYGGQFGVEKDRMDKSAHRH